MPARGTASRVALRIAGTVLIVCLVLAWLKSNPSAPAAPKDYSTGHINDGPVLGCTEGDDLKRVMGYFAQGDKAAGTTAMTELLDRHRCVELTNGEQVFIVHQGFSDEISVRRAGETVAYWTISRHVE